MTPLAGETAGQRIARARRRRGLSQAVLAGLVGRSESWLSQVERGKRGIDSHSALTRLAEILRVDVAEITGPDPGSTGQGMVAWMFRNPRRTRAGVSRPGGAGRSQGRRRSAASGRASRSWAWQAITIQVHRSAAAGSRSFGAVQPRTCLNSRKVCSRSNRRRNACHRRSTSAGAAPVTEHHSHTGLGSRSPGR